MNDQQVPASRPLYKDPHTADADPSKSHAALQGANLAFLPKSSLPTINVSSASASARLAALTAGTHANRRINAPPSESNYTQKEPSPPRGRPIHSSSYLIPTAPRGSCPPNKSCEPPRPSLHPRLSSTLAAQHATAHHHPPQRSPSRGQNVASPSAGTGRGNGEHTQSAAALIGATASFNSQTAQEKSRPERTQTVKHQIMNYERSFSSSSPSILQVTSMSNKRDTLQTTSQHHKNNVASSAQSWLTTTPDSQQATRPQLPRPELSRESSLESTMTVVTTPGVSTNRTNQIFKQGFPEIPPRNMDPLHLHIPGSLPKKQRRPSDRKSSMTISDLADAMVASSLASSRAASPAKKSSLPTPRQRSQSFPAPQIRASLNPSERRQKAKRVPRPMKQTLRKPASSDDEIELIKRGRRHWMRKHPNMHSEGDRKRWRDRVRERERKRYEGVFAANRGLWIGSGHFEPTPSALSDTTALGNQVVNVLVRDIWERSRLPREILKEIYDLVCPEEALALSREQFVVGLWLIDQRLKGRKLPTKVSASVWASVRHSQGIKIRR